MNNPRPDFSDPLARLLCAPMLAHMRREGIWLCPEADAVANEDTVELRELRAEQYAASLARRPA